MKPEFDLDDKRIAKEVTLQVDQCFNTKFCSLVETEVRKAFDTILKEKPMQERIEEILSPTISKVVNQRIDWLIGEKVKSTLVDMLETYVEEMKEE